MQTERGGEIMKVDLKDLISMTEYYITGNYPATIDRREWNKVQEIVKKIQWICSIYS
jgi:hypothetical protein